MANLAEVLLLSAIMGMSIYLSLPIVLNTQMGEMKRKMLLAVAIGILIFLAGDIFSDVTPHLYNGSLYGYGSSPLYDAVFIVSLVVGFFALFYFEGQSRTGLTPTQLSLLIALGIGLSNLTEGLVFGSLGVTLGFTSITLVVLIGFTFQNATEGFPIVSPFLAKADHNVGVLLGLFLIGGIPTILGGAIGYFYSSTGFILAFDGLAIGCILYIILPMFKALFFESNLNIQKVSYAGIFIGFAIGFAVNLL
jgi:zinc transporter, ZIP family